MGGLGTGTAFMANVQALAKVTFNMRLMHGISEPDTRTELLEAGSGHAGHRGSHRQGFLQHGRQAHRRGGIHHRHHRWLQAGRNHRMHRRRGASFIHESGLSAIKAAGGHGIAFIKPWENEELYEKLAKAKDSGATIVGADIGAAGIIIALRGWDALSLRNRLKRCAKSSQGWNEVHRQGHHVRGRRRLGPGSGSRRHRCLNHGGRVLDHAPGTAEVLPDIAREMKGKLGVIVDGGTCAAGPTCSKCSRWERMRS